MDTKMKGFSAAFTWQRLSPAGVVLLWAMLSCAGSDSAFVVENRVQAVAAQVLPCIVELNVLVIKDASDPNNLDDQPFFEYFFENPEGAKSAKPKEYRYQSLGAGILFARRGQQYYVASNRHVIGDGKEITVKLDDGREFTSVLVNQDERKDIAVVSFVCEDDLPVAVLGDSDELKTGSFVLALGSPYGFQSTTTLGIVSALHRRGGPSDNINDFIQTDASINQGNSGGALVNLKGEVIGINTWITSQTGDNVGLGFAIPINNIRGTLMGMVEGSPQTYGWFGVHMESLDLKLAKDFGLKVPKGVLVCSVYPGSPAQKAGLLPGDILMGMGKRELKSYEDLVQLVAEARFSGELTVRGIRGGKEFQKDIVLVNRPDDDALALASEQLWPGVVPYLSDTVAGDDAASKGIAVWQVVQGTALQRAGLKTQDIIVSIDGKKSQTIKTFFELIGPMPKPGMEIQIIRNQQTLSLVVPEVQS